MYDAEITDTLCNIHHHHTTEKCALAIMISHFALGHLSRLLHFKVAARERGRSKDIDEVQEKKREAELNKQHTLAHPCIFACTRRKLAADENTKYTATTKTTMTIPGNSQDALDVHIAPIFILFRLLFFFSSHIRPDEKHTTTHFICVFDTSTV